MDDTQPSRTSDAAANEFVTNEATTTWKNFYEEHNKSLESSSNDSEANASRQPVEHLGKRIFDQQFEEEEAVDIIGSLNANGSLNNVNFEQQLASLEYTADRQLTAPLNKFELSALTDQQSKVFGNDFTAPSAGEMSGRIDINFSAMQQVGVNDDLDEIQRDIEQASGNIGCHDPFDRENVSEYLEVDLNMTHVARNEKDMSITDTIQSPVQDVSKSCSVEKKASLHDDWMTDKENIAINPYAAPRESVNFAISDEQDQVLVFDGKRLTLQPDNPEKENNYRKTLLPNSSAGTPQRKTIVLNCNDDLPNFVDDVLNSKSENSGLSGVQDVKSNTMYGDDDMSMTLPFNKFEIVPKRKTILDNTGNISLTQALPTNILSETAVIGKENLENRSIIMMKDVAGNIPVTQSLPFNKIMNNDKLPGRRRTIVYEDDTCNISITQAVPTNILFNEDAENNEQQKTIVFDDDNGNISVTQALSSNNILEGKVSNKRKTIVFDDDAANLSITQVLPTNIVLSDKLLQENRRTIIYEDDTGNISVTQAVPSNVILAQQNEGISERRRTVVFENETGNISVTQALSSNIILESIGLGGEITKIDEPGTYPVAQSLPNNSTLKDSDVNKSRTIVYEDDTGNISITQTISNQNIPGYSDDLTEATSKAIDAAQEFNTKKRHRNIKISYDKEDDDDLSRTDKIIPDNIIPDNILPDEAPNKRDTIIFDNAANISMSRVISANVFLLDKLSSVVDQSINKPGSVEETNVNVINFDTGEPAVPISTVDNLQETRKDVVFAKDDCDADMTITEVLPKVENFDNSNKSMTKPIPAELSAFQNELLNKSSKTKELYSAEQDLVTNPHSDVIVYQAATSNSVPKLQSIKNEQGESKSKPNINSNNISEAKELSTSDVINDVEGSVFTEEGDSADVSLIHPRVEKKSDQLTLQPSIVAMDIDIKPTDFTKIKNEIVETEDPLTIDKSKDSLLDTLLDMSNYNMETEDKNFMAQIESTDSNMEDVKPDTGSPSNDSMFYITRDSDEEAQTDRELDYMNQISSKSANMPTIEDRSTLSQKYEDDDDPPVTNVLQEKLALLKAVVSEVKTPSINRFFETVISPNLEDVVERDENMILREQSLNFKKANNTQELLDMISDFTDMEDDEKETKTKTKGHTTLKNITEVTEPKRLSFASNKMSITLSREDLLNNISMAQAALHQSRNALNDSECNDEDTRNDSMDDIVSKKPARMSYEIVKTLHFDDESMSETSIKPETKITPLMKTAFGETSYMTENKGNVIPTYLKDVSDGIKELMLDLVKPMADNMPFDSSGTGKDVKNVPSTQSTQIQANLIASSQIDMHNELYFNADTGYDIDKMSSMTSGIHNPRSRSSRGNNFSEKSSDSGIPLQGSDPINQPSPARVLVFDHMNPLNNILLGSRDYSNVHKYNPKKSHEMHSDSNHSRTVLIHFDANTKDNQYDVGNVTTNYRLETQIPAATQGDVRSNKHENLQGVISNTSRTLSLDQPIGVKVMEVKDNEVNTLIAMKGNKELLEVSSSLTLVDDVLVHKSDEDSERRLQSDTLEDESCGHHKVYKSPLKAQYRIEDQGTATDSCVITDYASQDDDMWDHTKKFIRSKKRIYSPMANNCKPTQYSLDVTPKPNTKVQKMSYSPNAYRRPSDLIVKDESTKITSEKDVTDNIEYVDQKGHTSKIQERKKSPRKTKDNKADITLTVQQLITEYRVDSSFDRNTLHEQVFDTSISGSSTEPASQGRLEAVSSFTSSKNLNTVKDVNSTTTTLSERPEPSKILRKAPKVDWQPEVIRPMTSKVHDSDINVVAKIDMLPFMGSHECEWEASSADTWSFRLLHGRLRLTARLGQRHENSIGTKVMGNTPVLDITVGTVQHEKKNPVATLCIRFACETMSYMVARARRGECYASDIPLLLRRCASVARVALRWGRAMHDAKLHLAYTLDNDGYLSLKVANIPLRSVWEVSMRVELVAVDARSAPWPRASSVRVARVLSDVSVPAPDVRRALAGTPRDWGHAPRTIWRMFRYLKHKTRDDDLLLGP